MVKLITGEAGFANDICDEIRLFLGNTDILSGEAAEDIECSVLVSAFIDTEDGVWHARATVDDGARHSEYTHKTPVRDETALVEKRYRKRAVKIAVFRAMRQLYHVRTPWGSLTGIRPTRLYRELIETEGALGARRMMLSDFDVSPEKLNLAISINAAQEPILASQTADDVDVYTGIPYCVTRCLYCSFASELRTRKTDMEAYIRALSEDIELCARIVKDAGKHIRAMYMGGGTPTSLTADELERVIDVLIGAYGGFGREFTVEAGRPDTISRDKLRIMKRAGVSRISINPQTMNADTLRVIGRSHTPDEIIDCFNMAREEGFDNINMDVIAGLPGENTEHMERTMEQLIALRPESITVHSLALKRSSQLMLHLNEYSLVSAETAENMVSLAGMMLSGAGYGPYYLYRQKYMRGNLENTGYCLSGYASIYNVDMMEDTTTIMAHGACAMTKCVFDRERRVERIPNPKDVPTYMAKVRETAAKKRDMFASYGLTSDRPMDIL